MASPQKENGYTPIANEILEHLCMPGINGSEYRILLFVVRKTYGFQKKSDRVSLSQFQLATNMKRNHVVTTIAELVHKRVLLKEKSVYMLNKNWEEWLVHKRVPSTQTCTTASTQKGVKSSTQKGTHKRKKETNTKETTSKGKPLHEFNVLGAEIIKEMETVDPKNKTYYGNTTQRKACDFLLDEYGLEEVKKRIVVLPKTNKIPYFPTITTPLQLKEKWVQLQDAVDRKRSEVNSNNKKAF